MQPQFSGSTLFDQLVQITRGELDRRKGECHVECPNCRKPGSAKNTHFSFSQKGGHCFSCGQSYKLKELAEIFGYQADREAFERPTITPREIVPNEQSAVYVQKWKLNPEKVVTGFQEAIDTIPKWEAYRPFDLKTMATWRLGVGVLPSCQCRHRRLIYPVIIGGEIVGLRGREIDCGCKKWLQSAGSNAQLFNSDALVPGCIALIVESPVDVMLAEQVLRGKQPGTMPWVPIAGTAGARTWNHSWSELLRKKNVAGVLIWLDNDLTGDPNPKMKQKLLSMWRVRNPGLKTAQEPAAPKVAASLTSYGLKVDRYQWPDDAPAKADWGWLEKQGSLFETIVDAGLAFEEKLLIQPAALRQCDTDAHTLPDGEPGEPPLEMAQNSRTIKPWKVTEAPKAHDSIDSVRTIIDSEITQYYEQPSPGTFLLFKIQPGLGKTTALVARAEKWASEGKRVLYLAPYHKFFVDILQKAKYPELWREWLPRQYKDDANNKIETCRYANQMNTWLSRRHDANTFCARVCRYEYMENSCMYHRQKKYSQPIIFAMHQHLVFGHPHNFDIVIIDECPMGVFEDKMVIPGSYVAPPGLDKQEEATHIVHELAAQVNRSGVKSLEGPDLLRALGGARIVYDAADSFSMSLDAKELTPPIRVAGDAEQAPYSYLPMLFALLRSEANEACHGRDYATRVIVQNGHLTLLMRHELNLRIAQIPHIICLDATANTHVYETLFRRVAKVVEPRVNPLGNLRQIHTAGHGIRTMRNKKSSLRREEDLAVAGDNEEDELKPKVRRLLYQVKWLIKKYNYKYPVVVTYKAIANVFQEAGIEVLTFGAARGTNAAEDADALFVIGTFQPPAVAIAESAKMIFSSRMKLFDKEKRTDKDVGYLGQPWAHPVAGYWDDDDLNAVLQQKREAEIEQAVHRSRMNIRNCDVWLFSSLPLPDTAPTQLLTENQSQNVPEGVGVTVENWHQLEAIANEHFKNREPISSIKLAECLGVKPPTAVRYLEVLIQQQPDHWERGTVAQAKKGRPPTAAIPEVLD